MLLVKSGDVAKFSEWQELFASHHPTLPVRWWADAGVEPAEVTFVLAWEPPPGWLATLPSLQLIFSTGAGVDHIVRDPDWPRHVPIVRMASPELAQTVSEYVCMTALMLLRQQPRMADIQSRRAWDYFEPSRTALTTTVGIMGLGTIGVQTAAMLRGLGFRVSGWTRTTRSEPGIACYSGIDRLAAFLAQTDILVGLLPHTPETAGILNRDRLRQLPCGASLINVGRGSLVDPATLIAELDSGHLSAAVLDVFDQEPLPTTHPAWSHPKIIVTPHISGYATRRSKVEYVSEQIARFAQGQTLQNVYDPSRGY